MRRREQEAEVDWWVDVREEMAECISAFSADSRVRTWEWDVRVEERVVMRVEAVRRSSVR